MAAMRNLPCFRHFSRCETPGEGLSTRTRNGAGNKTAKTPLPGATVNRKIMDDGIQKSCWGVTAKAVVGFAGILLLAWLIGGPETAAVLAAS
jgi:hypothetical protein